MTKSSCPASVKRFDPAGGSFLPRRYRRRMRAAGLLSLRVVEGESDLLIATDRALKRDWVRQRLCSYRQEILDYSQREKRFFSSLKPLAVEHGAGRVVRLMAEAARRCGVGPMAAVAGAIAERIGKDLVRLGCREVLVENGGDLFIRSAHRRSVGIYAGPGHPLNRLRINIDPCGSSLGVCTSSGTVGHSLSFGSADCATVIAGSAAVADAAATALGNAVRGPHTLVRAVERVRGIRGVRGALIIVGPHLASWGAIELSA